MLYVLYNYVHQPNMVCLYENLRYLKNFKLASWSSDTSIIDHRAFDGMKANHKILKIIVKQERLGSNGLLTMRKLKKDRWV
jgi:hypothetical protein